MTEPLPILVVDDEPAIRRLLGATLKRAGYAPVEAESARMALSLADIAHPVAAFVDLGLPDRDGLELIQPLARSGTCPVIVVSARDNPSEKIDALDLGADDYVTKPFDTDELLARLRAALRRRAQGDSRSLVLRAGEIEIDLANRRVMRAQHEIRLTPKEWGFLAELARHPGKVLTHVQLLRAVWGPAHEDDVAYLRVTARALRLKLETDPAQPKLIRNEPAVGYRLLV